MKNAPSLRGLIVPMATPVLRNGDPDLPACARLARWLIGKGVGALFVCGTTGRFSHFTPEQNAAICRTVARASRKRVPVLAGIADSGFHRVISNAAAMKAAGADVLVATAPYYLKYTQAERERTLERVLDASPLPVVIYNIPELASPSLRWEWVIDAARHPRALGLKDSSNDWAWFEKVLARRPKKFVLIQGKEPLLARAMLAGADGVVISLSHMDPTACVELCRAAWRGDRAGAERQQRRVQALYDGLIRGMKRKPAMSTLMEYLEAGLRKQGMPMRLLARAEIPR